MYLHHLGSSDNLHLFWCLSLGTRKKNPRGSKLVVYSHFPDTRFIYLFIYISIAFFFGLKWTLCTATLTVLAIYSRVYFIYSRFFFFPWFDDYDNKHNFCSLDLPINATGGGKKKAVTCHTHHKPKRHIIRSTSPIAQIKWGVLVHLSYAIFWPCIRIKCTGYVTTLDLKTKNKILLLNILTNESKFGISWHTSIVTREDRNLTQLTI
jgi:hypothetical protein